MRGVNYSCPADLIVAAQAWARSVEDGELVSEHEDFHDAWRRA